MGDKTKIEWCDATINPFPGCSRALLPDGSVSPACVGCYAERVAARMSSNPTTNRYHGLALFRDGQPEWTGKIGTADSELEKPRRWTRPRRIFVESMGDVAHESITPGQFSQLWHLLEYNALRHEPHTFYLLTKRPAHLRNLLEAMQRRHSLEAVYWQTIRHVVVMTTTENQAAADARVPELLRCPALHYGVSAEPLVGPLDLRRYLTHPPRLGWVIAGGWSGPGATPSHPDWFRDLRDQAASAGAAFFFKQWGEWGAAPCDFTDFTHWVNKAPTWVNGGTCIDTAGRVLRFGADFERARDEGTFPVAIMHRLGKRAAGRLLDGEEHSAIPLVGVARG